MAAMVQQQPILRVEGLRKQFKDRNALDEVSFDVHEEEISAKANVTFFASLYGLRGKQLRMNVARALEFVGLAIVKTTNRTPFPAA